MAETYYGNPCAFGHENENGQVLRYRSSRACVECVKAAANTPEAKARSLKWQRDNKDRHKLTQAIALKQEANGSITP
jgi:hypothetical protein